MGRSYDNEKCEDELYMEEPDEKDESLSLCDLPINLVKDDNPHFLLEIKPRAGKASIAAADDDFDFGSLGGFSNLADQPPPEMCLADEVFYQGQLLPLRLSVSSDNTSAGVYRRHLRSINSSGSSSSRSQCSSSSVTNNSLTTTSAARDPRLRVPNLFHSHPSPKPQIKASPITSRQASTGGNRQKSSFTWDFFRLGVVKTPGMELEDLKHRSSTRRNSSVSRSNSEKAFVPAAPSNERSVKVMMRRPRESVLIERKSSGILSGVGCKCSVGSTVAPAPKAMVVVRRKGNGKNIPAKSELRMKKLGKEKEEEEKLELSRHRTFEWLKELSHANFSCEV
ncbi:probable membrane-associated kinase regulator 1 [Cucumis melo]|nr:probable membrane-associated kinase regulator 1 [Cucumis melo]